MFDDDEEKLPEEDDELPAAPPPNEDSKFGMSGPTIESAVWLADWLVGIPKS